MALDAYSPCPCGSGKKLKFGCPDLVAEMERVEKYQMNNQHHMALQHLEKIETKFNCDPWGNAWMATTKAVNLLNLERLDDAKAVLEGVLEAHPENTLAIALYATVVFALDGYEKSRTAIHRAFSKTQREQRQLLTHLAVVIAGEMLDRKRFLAARQHLAFALRLAPETEQRQLFLNMMQFDGNGDIPYPMRSTHELAEYEAPAEFATDAKKAARLSDLGCWGPAARIYTRLAEHDAENAGLWKNIGLCRAWDGEEQSAADALHKAATLYEDFLDQVECETLAQLLDMRADDHNISMIQTKYRVHSVSKLLSLLDQHEQFGRIEFAPPLDDEPTDLPAGSYDLLDRPKMQAGTGDAATLDTIPRSIGQFSVYNGTDHGDHSIEALAFLVAQQGDNHAAIVQLLQDAAGSEIEQLELDEIDGDPVVATLPVEFESLSKKFFLPAGTQIGVRKRIERQQFEEFVDNVWPNAHLSALAGKSPLEAAQDESLRLPLRASLFVLDAYCDLNGYSLTFSQIESKLGLSALEPIAVDDSTSLNTFSVMKLLQIPAEKLTDGQLKILLNRGLLVQHSGLLYAALTEVETRPEMHNADVDVTHVYLQLTQICQERFNHEEALAWVAKGRDFVASRHPSSIEFELRFAIREVSLRLEDPSDVKLTEALKLLEQKYFPKVPQLRNHIEQMLELAGVTPPWNTGGVETVGGASTPGGLWSPDQPATAADAGKKLWLPGQE